MSEGCLANGRLVDDQQILIFLQPTTNIMLQEEFISKFVLKIATYEGNKKHVYLNMLHN